MIACIARIRNKKENQRRISIAKLQDENAKLRQKLSDEYGRFCLSYVEFREERHITNRHIDSKSYDVLEHIKHDIAQVLATRITTKFTVVEDDESGKGKTITLNVKLLLG